MTTPLRTVLDCAGTLPFHEALAIADGALAYSFVRESELMSAALDSQGPGRRARVKVAAAADRRADNPFESVLRAIAIESGVGGLVPQVEIRFPRRLLYADLADVEEAHRPEADSFARHGTRGAFARDCDRYNDLVAAGWLVLRFPWERVMLQPERVTRVLVETCELVDGTPRRAGRARVEGQGPAYGPRYGRRTDTATRGAR